jgi:hypothetical protein
MVDAGGLLRRTIANDNAAMDADPKRNRRRFPFDRAGVAMSVFLISAAFAHAADSGASAVQIPSWGELDKDFAKALALEKPPDYGLNTSATFRQILDHGDKPLWLEMLDQRDHPVVVVAGYLCMRDKVPKRGFECALRAVGGKPPDSSIMLYMPMIELMQKVDSTPENLKTFSTICGEMEIKRLSGAIWILGFGVQDPFLSKWFADRVSDDAPWTLRAFVLDRLYSVAKEQKLPITARMKESLEAAGQIPGQPRLVFLNHTERIDADFSKMVFDALADSSIDDLSVYPILMNHLQWVREHNADLRRLSISEARVQIVKRAIDNATPQKK